MQIALNWLRQQQHQTDKGKGVIISIIGARTEAQIKDNNLGCLDFELTQGQLELFLQHQVSFLYTFPYHNGGDILLLVGSL
jgi:aryl-alcohol dehydrogenase-like predicted oxidoreductase